MKMSLAWLVTGLALAGSARAGAVIHVTTDTPATIYLDDEEIGDAPVSLKDLRPGKHLVKVEDVESGEIKTYKVISPKSATLERDIHVSFAGSAQSAPVVVPVAPAPATPAVVPVAPAPEAAPGTQTEPSASRGDGAAQDQAAIEKKTKDRLRNRTRNVVLGAALTNEVFNKNDQSKDFIRKAAVAIGLGNEALNR